MGLSICTYVHLSGESLLAQYFINCLGEFRQIYNFSAFRHKDELIRFWGQKVKGHNQAIYGQRRQRLWLFTLRVVSSFFLLWLLYFLGVFVVVLITMIIAIMRMYSRGYFCTELCCWCSRESKQQVWDLRWPVAHSLWQFARRHDVSCSYFYEYPTLVYLSVHMCYIYCIAVPRAAGFGVVRVLSFLFSGRRL